MDVIIVCHTEFGFVHNREVIYSKDATPGVTEGARNLTNLANMYGARVTFALMPEAADYFPKDLDHEVGLHIHPGWQEIELQGITFPVGDSFLRRNCRQSADSTVLRDYSYEEQLEMIEAGKHHLTQVFGIEPKSFVAGRWSINNDTVKALIKAGITHDCSAPAHARPSHHDWSRLPRICVPYHPSLDDYQQAGGLPLTIVPISQMLRGGNVNPEVVPIVGLPWLKACFKEYCRQGVPLFHICLHSPCMLDPYFIRAMDELLGFIARHDIEFKFASDIECYGEMKPRTDIRPYLLGINLNIMLGALRFGWQHAGAFHVSSGGRELPQGRSL